MPVDRDIIGRVGEDHFPRPLGSKSLCVEPVPDCGTHVAKAISAPGRHCDQYDSADERKAVNHEDWIHEMHPKHEIE
jgi:hypothetical protein